MKVVNFSLENGDKYFAKIDGARFFVGRRVSYEGGKGLMNVSGSAEQRYNRLDYRPKFGFWADFIHPTAMAEGALFHTLNTYDRALFTFSFLQFAAHVPNGDFVSYMRKLLTLPLAADYFPDLVLENNRVCRRTNQGNAPLESNSDTTGLQDYLNPTRGEVEDTEIIQSAKFVHWVQNDPLHREAQVALAVDNFKTNMAAYSDQYGLDGADDFICLLVADIRHQGRAKSPAIFSALASNNPKEALLQVGEHQYPERIKTLRREIKVLIDNGTLGVRRYNRQQRAFI